MKSLIIAASAVALAAAAAPAMAQTTAPAASGYTWLGGARLYGTLGDTYATPDRGSVNEVTARLGARWGSYLGMEGELGFGTDNLKRNNYTVGEPVTGALYGVVFYPVAPNIDLLARAGYGASDFHSNASTAAGHDGFGVVNSFNYGVGAQYFLTANDGIRGDYTRRQYVHTGAPYDADTWGVSYVRKF